MTNKELAAKCKKALRLIDEDFDPSRCPPNKKDKWEHFSEAFESNDIYRVFELANHWDNDLNDWCDEMLDS